MRPPATPYSAPIVTPYPVCSAMVSASSSSSPSLLAYPSFVTRCSVTSVWRSALRSHHGRRRFVVISPTVSGNVPIAADRAGNRVAEQRPGARAARSLRLPRQLTRARPVLRLRPKRPPPASGFVSNRFDVLLEALQVALHPPVDDANHVGGGFQGILRFVLHVHGDTRPVAIPERPKLHGADVRLAGIRLPDDASIRLLLDDLRVPLSPAAADLRDPVEPVGRQLLDLLDAFHELGKLLEHRPLVVDGADRQIDIDG